MALENIARCDNCKTLKTEGNNWFMGNIVGEMTIEITISHFDQQNARGKSTWCGIPCIQQALGKELEGSTSEPCANPASGGITGRSKTEKQFVE